MSLTPPRIKAAPTARQRDEPKKTVILTAPMYRSPFALPSKYKNSTPKMALQHTHPIKTPSILIGARPCSGNIPVSSMDVNTNRTTNTFGRCALVIEGTNLYAGHLPIKNPTVKAYDNQSFNGMLNNTSSSLYSTKKSGYLAT